MCGPCEPLAADEGWQGWRVYFIVEAVGSDVPRTGFEHVDEAAAHTYLVEPSKPRYCRRRWDVGQSGVPGTSKTFAHRSKVGSK